MNTHRAVKVLAEGNRRSDNSAQIEDGPEDTDEDTLLALGRIGQHERSLGRPEQSRANTKDSTGSDDEAASMRVDIDGTA